MLLAFESLYERPGLIESCINAMLKQEDKRISNFLGDILVNSEARTELSYSCYPIATPSFENPVQDFYYHQNSYEIPVLKTFINLAGAAAYTGNLSALKSLKEQVNIDLGAICYASVYKLKNGKSVPNGILGFNSSRKDLLEIALLGDHTDIAVYLFSEYQPKPRRQGGLLSRVLKMQKMTVAFLERLREDIRVDLNFHIHDKNENGQTVLHVASELGAVEVAEWLLQYGVNPNIQSSNKRTPLHVTNYEQQMDMTKCLLENGADINAQNEYDNTPFFHAIDGFFEHQNKNIFKVFIEHGAFLHIPNNLKNTPFEKLRRYYAGEGRSRDRVMSAQDLKKGLEKFRALMKFLIACTREREGWLDAKFYSDGMVELFQRLEHHTQIMFCIKYPTIGCFKSDHPGLLNRCFGLARELRDIIFLWALRNEMISNIEIRACTEDIESEEQFQHLKQLVLSYNRLKKLCDENNTVTACPKP